MLLGPNWILRRFFPICLAFASLTLAQPWTLSSSTVREGEPVRIEFAPSPTPRIVRAGPRFLAIAPPGSTSLTLPPLPPGTYPLNFTPARTPRLLTVEGDPLPEATVTDFWLPQSAQSPRRHVLVSDGRVTIDSHPLAASNVLAAAPIDWNADGLTDLLLASRDGIHIALATPSGDFPEYLPFAPAPPANAEVTNLVPGDWNNDGAIDLLLGTSTGIALYEGPQPHQPRFFETAYRLPAGSPEIDWNSDGLPDLLVAKLSKDSLLPAVWLGNGTGGFFPQSIPRHEQPQVLALSGQPSPREATVWGDTANGKIYTVAGNGNFGFSGDGGPAASAQIALPHTFAADPAGNVYFSDYGNLRIRKLDPTNKLITTVAGAGLSGTIGDGIPANTAFLNQPRGIAFDGDGVLYIADANNSRVRRVDPGTGYISTIAGTGAFSSGPDGGIATSTPLHQPGGVAHDGAGNLYIAETAGYRIRKITLHNLLISTVAGTGQPGFSGDNGPASQAQIGPPSAITTDTSGHIYFSDAFNHRIRRIDANTGIITTVAGNGTQAAGGEGTLATATPLHGPAGLRVLPGGVIYFAEYGAHRIRRVSGGIITTIAGAGTQGYGGDNGPALLALLNQPSDILFDRSGNLYIADSGNQRIRFVDRSSPVITFAAPAAYFSHTATTGSMAFTTSPAGTAWTAVKDAPWLSLTNSSGTGSGSLAFSFSPNTSLHSRSATVTLNNFFSFTVTQAGVPAALSESAKMISTAAGSATLSLTVPAGTPWTAAATSPWLTVSPASGTGPATVTYSFTANASATARVAALVVAGRRFSLTQIGTSGNYSPFGAVPPGFIQPIIGAGPYGVSGDGGPAIDARIELPNRIVVDFNGNTLLFGNGIRRVDAATGIITSLPGINPVQVTDGAVDPKGNIFIADSNFDYIRRIDAVTGAASIIAGNGTRATTGDGGPASAASVAYPVSIAVDNLGNVYFLEFFECRIRQIHAETGIVRTVAGLGACGFSGDNGLAVSARFDRSNRISLDANGDIYLVDAFNVRIRKITVATGVITTFAGNGTSAWSGDGGPAPLAGFNAPGTIGQGPDGAFYIREAYRLRKVAPGTNIISTIGGTGGLDYSGDGGPVAAAQIGTQYDMNTDAFGNLYLAHPGTNSNRIRFVSQFVPQSTLAAPSASVPPTAGTGTVGIAISPAGAAWTTYSSAPWLSASPSGQGNSVTFSYLANTGLPRSATLLIGDQIFTVNQAAGSMPAILSASPANPTGSPQTLSIVVQDPDGRADLNRIHFAIADSPTALTNACTGFWDRTTNALFLSNDANSATAGPLPLGGPGTLQNAQCTLSGAGSSLPAGTGTSLTLNLNLSLRGAFSANVHKIFASARDTAANDSGWTQTGIWFPTSRNRAPALVSLASEFVEHQVRRLAIRVRDLDGHANISRVSILLAAAPPPSTGACHSFYDHTAPAMFLYSADLLTIYGPIPLNSGNGSMNGTCAVNGFASVTPEANGTDLTLSVNYSILNVGPISQKIFVSVRDLQGNDTGWLEAGAWYLPTTPVAPAIQKITTSPQSLSVLANDANGSGDIARIEFLLGDSTASLQNVCAGYFDESSKTFVLFNDAGAPTASLENSQCTLNAAGAPAFTAGLSTLQIHLPLDLKPAFAASPRTVYARVRDDAGNTSPWLSAGTWPLALNAPAGPSLSATPPISGAGAEKTFTIHIDHPDGAQLIDVANVLINRVLDGRNACYIAYSRPLGVLYLVANEGPPALSQGLVLGAAGSVQNSQCRINAAASSAAASANRLTLTLNVTFFAPLAGNNVVYTAARDTAGSNSGWRTQGVHQVPFTRTYPDAIAVSPASGTAATQLFELTYDDASAATNLQTAWMLINTAIDGRQACYIAYYRPANLLYLIPDNGDGTQATSVPLSGSNTIENSQCRIETATASATTSGQRLTLRIPIQFKPAFSGPKGIWSAVATTNSAAVSPWQALGAWVIPQP